MIAVIGAMDQEIRALVGEMKDVKTERAGYAVIASGTLWGRSAAVCRCGIGKVHAAMGAQALILSCRPEALIHIGVAGALWPEARIGDVIVAEKCVQHDVDTSPVGDPVGLISGIDMVYLPCDEELTARLYEKAGTVSAGRFRGVIASGDQFVDGPDKKALIHDRFGALTCDMESAAIAQTAYEYGVPFAAYRCVSDTLYGSGAEYQVNAALAAEKNRAVLRAFMTD